MTTSTWKIAIATLALAALAAAQNDAKPQEKNSGALTPAQPQQVQVQQQPSDDQQSSSNAPIAASDNGFGTALTPGDNARMASGGLFRFAVPGAREVRNFFTWSASLQQGAQSGTPGVPGADWTDQTTTGLQLAFNRSGHTQDFSASYQGGSQFNGELTGNLQPGQKHVTYFHQLELSDTLRFGRLELNVANHTQYTPQSGFGFTGNGVPGDFASSGTGMGASNPAIDPGLVPNDSINNGYTSRVSNTTALSATYRLTGKNVISGLASFGLIDFVDGGGIDGQQMMVQASFQHWLSRRTWISVSGDHSRFWYPEFDGVDVNSESGMVGITRQFSKRLTASVSAGPQVSHSDFLNFDRLGYTVAADVAYGWRRNALTAAYNHGVSGGSGVLLGSTADTVTGSFRRQLHRVWNVGLNGGYARQTPLLATTTTVSAQFGGASVSRELTREASLSLGYGVYRFDNGICLTSSCDGLQHRVSLQFNWNARPMRVR